MIKTRPSQIHAKQETMSKCSCWHHV